MFSRVNRRTLIKGAAGAASLAAVTKASPSFAAPAVIQSGPVEVTFWSSFSAALGDSMNAVVDEFNASQSEIKINNQFQGTYEETAQKITAALPANQAPDMAILSEIWWFKFFANNILAPLNDLMSSTGFEKDDYVDSLINEGFRNDTQWWIPFARSTPLFYYNKDVFAEAGLTESPKTWDEFVAVAPSMVTDTRSAFAHPPASNYIAWHFQGVVWQYGGRYSDDDFNMMIQQPEAVAAGEFYKSSVADGWATMSADPTPDFTSGLTAAMFASTGGLKNVQATSEFNVGTGFFPEGPAGFGCCTGGSGLSIFKNAAPEKQAAAFEFIKWATSPEKTEWWSQNTGYMPVRKSAFESETMKAFFAENPNFETAVNQLALTKPQDPARIYVPNGDQIIGGALERIMIDMEDVATVFQETADTLTDEAQPVIEQLAAL
jgi:sn-glycerol 3-phosphate transport system substrate-binding protein